MRVTRLAPAASVVERALELAGSGETIVVVEDRSEAELRFANNTTTTNGERRDRRVSVARIHHRADGPHVGVASASGWSDVSELVAAADADAAAAPPADDGAPLSFDAEDENFAEDPTETSLEVFSRLLGELGEAFGRARAEGYVLAGFASHALATTYLGASNGLRRRHAQPTGTFELVARRPADGASTWAGVGTADFTDVSLAQLEATARRRLEWSGRRLELPAGRYEVLLPPDAVADLVIEIDAAASGREAEDGGTVFSAASGRTRRGEQLCELPFRLFSDPAHASLACAPFLVAPVSGTDVSVFDNGAPVHATDWIRRGRLERLRYHRAGAARSGEEFTPPVDNLVLELPGASASLDEMVRRTRRALLLTCLWYIRVVDVSTLLLTGLTRDGVYLVEDGEVVGAVNNFRFNESPLDVLAKTLEAGRTERALSREWGEWLSRTAMPPLRVAEFNMSSVSPAS